jgi:hypothetical protein
MDRDGAAEMRGVGVAEMRIAGGCFRKHCARHVEQRAHLIVPVTRIEIVKQRARRVGNVRDMRLSVGKAPHEERLDGAERKLALFGASAQ